MAATRLYSIKDIDPHAQSGTWTYTTAANILSYDKTAADTTNIMTFAVPKLPRTEKLDDPPVSVIAVTYSVATTALDAAVTAVLNLLSKHATTKVWSRSAVTQVLTFAGTDTTGTAAGTFDAITTITTPVRLADNESYELELTFNGAAGTVVKLFGMAVTHTGA